MVVTGPCQGCTESPWVQAAQTYIANHTGNPSKNRQVAVLNFLLSNGYCGQNHRTSLDAIINALGLNISVPTFQQEILDELKDEGTLTVFVYSGGTGGVFIPCTDAEMHEAARQMFSRVYSELDHLEGSAKHSSDHAKIRIFKKIAEAFKDSM